MRTRRIVLIAVTLLAALGAPAAAQAAPTITEFPASASGPSAVARGADGNVWFAAQPNPGPVARVTADGTVTTFQPVSRDGNPAGIVDGPGGLWFTQNSKNKIGRITTSGVPEEFSGGRSHDHPVGITAGPDGNVWFTATGSGNGAISRITPQGVVTEFTSGLTAPGSDITLGPDGNLWFTEPTSNRIGRVTPQGTITEFSIGILGTPREIAAGPDGNLWFTESGLQSAIGRITPSGVITEFRVGLPLLSAPQGITAGADGNVYFTDNGANAIGRVTPNGTITTFNSGLTAGASLQGITTGGDGRLWFAESGSAKLGRMTVAPTAGAVTESAVDDVTATVSAPVTPNSQGTTAHFEWGTTASYGNATADVDAGSGASPQTMSAGLTGLSPSTTYYVRLVASNATGTTYGPDRTFTTTEPGAPTATSDPAGPVGATDATLNATVNPENAATAYHFEWGPDTGYGSTTADTPVGSDGVDHPVSAALSGLEPNTTYHCRVVAFSPGGTTYGADETFTTDAVPPGATTAPATSVTSDGATLAGAVDPINSATTYRFEWGPTTAYGTSVPAPDAVVGSDHSAHPVAEALTGLAPNMTYHFRLVATSNAGITYGDDQAFTTAAVAPAATTGAASAVSADGATLSGDVDPNNSTATYRFEWGETPAYGSSVPAVDGPVGSDHTVHTVGETLSGLAPNTTYHFRLVATSDAGVTRGPDQTFTTAVAAPGVANTDARALPSGGATFAGTVDPNNSATTYRFEWGETAAYGNRVPAVDAPVASDHAVHTVTQRLASLAPNTTYHVRLVATNNAGVTAGADQTFTTPPAPPASSATPPPPAAGPPASDPAPPTTQPAPSAPASSPASTPAAKRPTPRLGRTAVVEVSRGTIRFRAPGRKTLTVLRGDRAIPSGSIVDARKGTLVLENALDRRGRTQKASFRGAMFKITLSRGDRGMVDIRLLEAPPVCRTRSAVVAGAARVHRRRARRLWIKDRHGRYRTHGRNSVAIVRGTEWTTAETCTGTVTRVIRGAVQVRDLHTGKRVLVKAGHAYRARPAR